MEIQKALELLRQYRDEINHLKTLPPYNNEYWLWKNKVHVVSKDTFGVDSEEYLWLHPLPRIKLYEMAEAEKREEYLRDLQERELEITKILEKYEIIGIPTTSEVGERSLPSVFIAHGGESAALNKLCSFLKALGVEPLVVEVQPSEGRLTESQVDKYMKQADCAIILATYGHIVDTKTHQKHPRLNVVDELGRCRKVFPRKTILLLEKGVDLPSNVSGIVYERFTKQNRESAFIKVAKELRAFNLIKPMKPSG